MNKTLNINLGGLIFHIDEEAYNILERYLHVLKLQFSHTQGGSEIIKDIELRIAEIFRERTTNAKEVITKEDVDEVIAVMGKPEDYLDSDEDSLNEPLEDYMYPKTKRMFRDPDDRVLGGVAAGLAAYLNVEPLWMRILFVILLISGFGFFLYIILWLVMPKAVTTADKLQMRGEPVTVSNIEKSIREEMDHVGGSFRKYSKNDRRNGGSKAGNFLQDLLNLIIEALKLILGFILKLIGLFFICLGFVFLFALIIALFTGGTYLIGTGYETHDFYEFMQLLSVNQGHLNLFIAGVILLIVAPLILLTYFGVRLIFGLGRMNRSAMGGLVMLCIIGVVLMIASGIRLGIEFDHQSEYTTTETIKNSLDTIVIQSIENEFNEESETYKFGNDWLVVDGQHYFDQVYFNVLPSTDGKMYIEKKYKASGPTRRAARNHAQTIDFNYTLTDSALALPHYYRLQENAKFRDQEVLINLYLPVGKSVFFDLSLDDILFDVINVDDYYDRDMLNHTWQMTEQGLKCSDCPPTPASEYREYHEYEPEDTNQQHQDTSAGKKLQAMLTQKINVDVI